MERVLAVLGMVCVVGAGQASENRPARKSWFFLCILLLFDLGLESQGINSEGICFVDVVYVHEKTFRMFRKHL